MRETKMRAYTDDELLYAATARCNCGAGVAYPLDSHDALGLGAWCCAEALKGVTDTDHDRFPFAFWKIREETSINNHGGATTRPAGSVAQTVGHATCGQCGHEWSSEPYSACGASHHWFPRACPKCGNDAGANGMWSSTDPRPRVETRYRTVVLREETKNG
ncbi:MAG: hypothetical protein WC538_22010 [Thermoanaerobaculia bacterium]|jgi:hypothetical protein